MVSREPQIAAARDGGTVPSSNNADFFEVLSRVLSAMEGAVEVFHIIGEEDKDKARHPDSPNMITPALQLP